MCENLYTEHNNFCIRAVVLKTMEKGRFRCELLLMEVRVLMHNGTAYVYNLQAKTNISRLDAKLCEEIQIPRH